MYIQKIKIDTFYLRFEQFIIVQTFYNTNTYCN